MESDRALMSVSAPEISVNNITLYIEIQKV